MRCSEIQPTSNTTELKHNSNLLSVLFDCAIWSPFLTSAYFNIISFHQISSKFQNNSKDKFLTHPLLEFHAALVREANSTHTPQTWKWEIEINKIYQPHRKQPHSYQKTSVLSRQPTSSCDMVKTSVKTSTEI